MDLFGNCPGGHSLHTQQCNGFRPTCLFCSEQSIPCEYDVKEGYSTKDRHKQELSRLQQDGKSALNFITYLQTESDEKATDLLRFIRSAEKPDIGALATYIQASGYETPSAFLEDSPGAPAGEASSIPVVDPGDESSQPVPHEAAGQQPPLSEPCGTIDYHTEVGWYGSSC